MLSRSEAANLDTPRIKTYTRLISTWCVESSKGGMAIEQDLFLISMAAEMLGMHPQTLRKYERLGLIQPSRTIGSMRLYSREELERLRLIKHLVDELGINLAGVQRLLSVAEVMQRIRPLMDEGALNTGAARRQLLTEMRRLNDVLGL
jgi:MerR family transcriptional regulator, heat shock protein HspR